MLSQEVAKGENYTSARIGEFSGLDDYKFAHPELSFEVDGKIFLNSLLDLTIGEISINKLPPKASMPFHHEHQNNEEIYIFIKGLGEFQVDDHIFPVNEGTVIRVAPEGVRCWRNLSNEPLYYIVVQAPVGGYGKSKTIEDGKAVKVPFHWKIS